MLISFRVNTVPTMMIAIVFLFSWFFIIGGIISYILGDVFGGLALSIIFYSLWSVGVAIINKPSNRSNPLLMYRIKPLGLLFLMIFVNIGFVSWFKYAFRYHCVINKEYRKSELDDLRIWERIDALIPHRTCIKTFRSEKELVKFLLKDSEYEQV